MARVRAYIGLGANVGDAAATLAAAVLALAALPGARLAWRLAALRHGSRRRHRPAGVPQRGRLRSTFPRAPTPPSAPRRCSSRSRGWSGRSAAGSASAGVRARSISTSSSSGATVSASSARLRVAPTTRRGALPLPVPHVEARNRLFVLALLSDLARWLSPPGWGETVSTAADRRRDLEGPDAARPIAAWDWPDGWARLPTRTLPGVKRPPGQRS